MRQLTIRRAKSSVACLTKVKLYIEDATANDLVINGVACRKLGELKNGEEKTFTIGEEAAKVYAIAGKMSKNYCNEYYPLPAGQEDLFLSGKNRYNPANGNAFRFDNNDTPDVLENRKKNSFKGLAVLAVSLIVGFALGYFITTGLLSSPDAQSKTFSDSGMHITLTDAFTPTQAAGRTACYESAQVAVFALKEEFTMMTGLENYTLQQYGEAVVQSNELPSTSLKSENGLLYFEYDYTNPDTLQVYTFVSYVYKAPDSFWLIQFTTEKEDASSYRAQITEWAQSVSFD